MSTSSDPKKGGEKETEEPKPCPEGYRFKEELNAIDHLLSKMKMTSAPLPTSVADKPSTSLWDEERTSQGELFSSTATDSVSPSDHHQLGIVSWDASKKAAGETTKEDARQDVVGKDSGRCALN